MTAINLQRCAVAVLTLVLGGQVGCSSPNEKQPDKTDPDDAARDDGEAEMVETVRSLCRLLSTDPLTVDDVVSHLGEFVEDLGEGAALVVRPHRSAFPKAHIYRDTSTEVAYVRLFVAVEKVLTFDAMRTAFGNYGPGGARAPEVGVSAVFHYDGWPDLPYRCSILTRVTLADDLDRYVVSRVTLRRDKR